jgi:hypothetical protein
VIVYFADETADEFSRLHRLFVFHVGVAVGLAWMTALYAAVYAPWVRNIRPLIDPLNLGHSESTASFLFGLPVLLTVAWAASIVGRDLFRRLQVMRSQTTEFGLAAAAAFVVFYLSIDRAVTALLLGV